MHFLNKREARRVPWEAIAKALSEPHVTEPHEGKVRYSRDGLTVVATDPSECQPVVLVTLLLRRQRQWTDEDVHRHVDAP